MKIFGHTVSPMYLWVIALLSALAALSSYTLREVPIALIIGTALAACVEIALRAFYLRQTFKIPFSGIITGIIIGSVAPINAPLAAVVLAVLIGVLSKFLLQHRSVNILNPASIGLLVSLPLFGLGDEWWAAGNYNMYGMAISLTPILIVLAYSARRLTAAASFIIVMFVFEIAFGALSQGFSAAALASMLFGINYFFAFVMLTEPKTSPHPRRAQALYGAAVALMFVILAFSRLPYPLLIALLAGNVLYFAYKKYLRGRTLSPYIPKPLNIILFNSSH